ncbi:superoxide dismutase [Virgibacillus xinjiangensis]|uniref:superoxide dismutase n=1 Tax=Virgibacillus xinjiangensis TaxID=393090 RepID=A0ABV7CRM6_9BACI
MDEQLKTHLQELINWGEDTKESLSASSLSELEIQQWLDQVDLWQWKVNELLQDDRELTSSELNTINEEGKRIFKDIKKWKDMMANKEVPYGKHELPTLPYAYNALEPYISEEIMRLHHLVHHQSYVDELNKAENELYNKEPNDSMVKHWLREQAFHGSGHYLHSIFWKNMIPDGSGEPHGMIRRQIEKDFGSWPEFKSFFTKVASSVEGVGWAVLLWVPASGRLAVQSFEKHQLFQLADGIPLLVLDVWEHAYYLQYQTERKQYIENWWNIVNWQDVDERLMNARVTV